MLKRFLCKNCCDKKEEKKDKYEDEVFLSNENSIENNENLKVDNENESIKELKELIKLKAQPFTKENTKKLSRFSKRIYKTDSKSFKKIPPNKE